MRFELTGFREFERKLLELATKDAKRIGRRALKKAAEPILAEYKAKTKVRSGALEESEALGERSKLNTSQKRRSRKPGPNQIEMHVGTADPAGIMEEFGLHQDANPALTQAWDRHGGVTAINAIGKELGAGIERAARRRARGNT